MSPRRIAVGRSRLAKAVIALAGVSALLGAVVAYAANRPDGRETGLAGSKPAVGAPQSQGSGSGNEAARREERLPEARFIEFPDQTSYEPESQFRFHVLPRQLRTQPPAGETADRPAPQRRFRCRLDGGSWSLCTSPFRFRDLALGGNSFEVRALTRAGKPGPTVSYSWQQAERPAGNEDPLPFSIESAGAIADLYPGDPAQQVPISIINPNPVPIEVTSLSGTISGAPLDCPAANFELTPSSVSATVPLQVPAGGSVTLPAPGVSAPTLAMLNLPENQDACRGADVEIFFSGEAHG